MSVYKGWAVKLSNGKYMNDNENYVGPVVVPLKRDAEHEKLYSGDKNAKVVKVTVTVQEVK